ncbi:uncharacterized protein LOC104417553 [Eucalyptus grandis]|uniref:Uncharacterized protein n=3 Tax=Eucalyptus grandis TaxID=71139 RepID=A0A059B6L8_EUCGR|nr:uncharacterized protein LOC104417553 [Eucalyptus grandis]KAK3418086.1 hypothetical protein EUGRSUZ_H04057 [Eucalyptus grandis]KAK3418087.1 hypothetical protein EUGRSUZ_H04057 [Eucalyptus grandis]
MKAAFALFLVLVLIVAALQADAKPMNLQGRRLMATTASSKNPDFTSTTSTSSTPTTATTTGYTDTKTRPEREKNDGYNNYSSAPVDDDEAENSHRVIIRP